MSPSSQKREIRTPAPAGRDRGCHGYRSTSSDVAFNGHEATFFASGVKHVGWKSGVFFLLVNIEVNVMRDSSYLRQKQLGVKKRPFGEA